MNKMPKLRIGESNKPPSQTLSIFVNQIESEEWRKAFPESTYRLPKQVIGIYPIIEITFSSSVLVFQEISPGVLVECWERSLNSDLGNPFYAYWRKKGKQLYFLDQIRRLLCAPSEAEFLHPFLEGGEKNEYKDFRLTWYFDENNDGRVNLLFRFKQGYPFNFHYEYDLIQTDQGWLLEKYPDMKSHPSEKNPHSTLVTDRHDVTEVIDRAKILRKEEGIDLMTLSNRLHQLNMLCDFDGDVIRVYDDALIMMDYCEISCDREIIFIEEAGKERTVEVFSLKDQQSSMHPLPLAFQQKIKALQRKHRYQKRLNHTEK